MPITQIPSQQILDGGIQRSDLCTAGAAGTNVIAKALQGAGIQLSSSGNDAGTGDVTVNLAAIANNAILGNNIGASAVPVGITSWADPPWLTALAFSKITGLPTTLAGHGITSPLPVAQGGTGNTLGAEPPLGNPSVTGYILSSTTAGVRSWIVPPAGGAGTVTSIATSSPITGGTITGTGTIGFNTAVDLGMTVSQSMRVTDSAGGTQSSLFTIKHDTSSTPGTNYGSLIWFVGESNGGTDRNMMQIGTAWSNAVDASRASYMNIKLATGGTTFNEVMRLFGSGGLSVNSTTDPGAGWINAATGFMTNGSQIATNDLAAVVTSDTPAAGKIGQTIVSAIVTASAVSLVNNTPKTITSISLTAGDWEVQGCVLFLYTSQPTQGASQLSAGIGTTANTVADDGYQSYGTLANPTAATQSFFTGCPVPPRRMSLASTTTVYLCGNIGFTSGTVKGCGYIEARRIR